MIDSIKISTKANTDHDSRAYGAVVWGSCGGADWVVAQVNKTTVYLNLVVQSSHMHSRESGQMFLHICQEGLTCIYEWSNNDRIITSIIKQVRL